MKLTVLAENTSKIDRYLLAEPSLSFYIEADNKKILYDCGYSNVFIKNAFTLNIDLRNTTDVVFSHGHNDHTGGLSYLIQLFQTSIDLGFKINKKNITAHPDIFLPKIESAMENVGCAVKENDLSELFNVNLTSKPCLLTEKLYFLGEIPRIYSTNTECIDDSALVYNSYAGLVIITGCAHSGLKNIIEYAKIITGETKINTLLGGFHLINKPKEEIIELALYLKSLNIQNIYPCHCVDLAAKILMSNYINILEINTGDIFNF